MERKPWNTYRVDTGATWRGREWTDTFWTDAPDRAAAREFAEQNIEHDGKYGGNETIVKITLERKRG